MRILTKLKIEIHRHAWLYCSSRSQINWFHQSTLSRNGKQNVWMVQRTTHVLAVGKLHFEIRYFIRYVKFQEIGDILHGFRVNEISVKSNRYIFHRAYKIILRKHIYCDNNNHLKINRHVCRTELQNIKSEVNRISNKLYHRPCMIPIGKFLLITCIIWFSSSIFKLNTIEFLD